MSKIYLVKAVEVGVSADDAFDYVVGYATSFEEAEAACRRLKDENKKAHEFWSTYGKKCYVECEAWPSKDDPKAIDALKEEQLRNKCPYAKLELKELFYGNDNRSSGVEVICLSKSDKCYCPTEYEYVIEEVEKL